MTQELTNKAALSKVSNDYAGAGPNFTNLVRVGIPLHPGAAKFWKEQGAKIPPELIK